ncbi:hypothetical protein RCM64_05040 [Escherichia marmotae]|uniref:hypothetical protein n=1 Tax=Escherichia marmotae TaxID=1499973 RepID=UPI0024340663|nr:hypothetical protein [Escherichia marmotae]MED9089947.1 hypothetical protein [Escherichia marmotae]WFZ16087.1 hypothetical protein NFK54_07405 [Escherichia marmotae]
MKITDILVNPDNYDQFNISTKSVDLGCATVSAWLLNGKQLDKCLDAHMTVNSFLAEKTHWQDAGGKYAEWLESMGFEYQSDEGWWSIIAVTPETIECFVKYSNDDDYKHQVDSAIERYKRKSFNHEISSVLDFIEIFK